MPGSKPTGTASPAAAVSLREAEDTWVSKAWPLYDFMYPVNLLSFPQALVPVLLDGFFLQKDWSINSFSIISKPYYSWSYFASLCASLQNFCLELCAGFHFSWCTHDVPVEYPVHV